MIQALIFDFDGLILDTELPDFECWREIYRAHGAELELATWAPCVGTVGAFDPLDDLEGRLGRALDRPVLRRELRERIDRQIETQSVLPGVMDYLAAAKRLGLKLGVASSSSREWVGGHLSRLGLDYFDCIRCSDDVSRVKPHPDLYEAVLAALALRPEQAIAFEDSPNGVRAAKQAGVFCVAVPNAVTRTLALDGADLRIASLAEIPLERLLDHLPPR